MTVVAVSKPRVEMSSLLGLGLAALVVAGWAWFNLQGHVAGWVANTQSLPRLDALMRNYGDIAVSALIQAGVVWAVLYFGLVRRKAPGRGFSDLAVLLATSVVLQAGVMHFAVARADAAPASADMAQSELTRAMAAAEDVEAHQAGPGVDGASGDRAALRQVMGPMAMGLREERRRYLFEMRNYNFNWHVSSMALASIPGVERAKDRLGKARVSLAAYRAKVDQRIAQGHAAAAASDFKDKAAGAAAFDKAAGQLKADIGRTQSVQEELLGEYDALVKLAANRSSFTYAGGKLTFRSAADQEAYRTHREKSQELESRFDPETGMLKPSAR